MYCSKNNLVLAIFVGMLIGIISCSGEKYPQGKIYYEHYCASCHGENGEGLKTLIPPLANADFLEKHTADLPCIIVNGIKEPIVVNGVEYNQPMEGIPNLKPDEITNIINYIGTSWGNNLPFVKPKEVREALSNCKK